MLTPSNPEASRDQMLNEAIPAQNWAVLQSQALSDWWGRLFQVGWMATLAEGC